MTETTSQTGLADMNGMWRSLIAADIDNDGDMDLVAGNLGLNCDYRVSADDPMQLYAADLDKNGSIDPVLFYYIKGEDGKRILIRLSAETCLPTRYPLLKNNFCCTKIIHGQRFDDIFKDKPAKDILSLHAMKPGAAGWRISAMESL